jgi:acetyltransferase-like isoleucine patch superfamily enzyme
MTNNTGKPLARFEDPFALFGKMLAKLYSVWVSTTFPFSSVGRNLSIHYACQLSRRISPRISLGNSVILRKNAWINVLEEAQGATNLSIGDRTCINAQCTISAKNSIQIESDVMVSSCTLIMDHNHSYEDTNSAISDQGTTPGGTIRIEKGCWIGYGAAIVCNQGELVLGANSVVAANALVTRSCPPYSVLVGNPARLVRAFDSEKGIWVGGNSRATVAVPAE